MDSSREPILADEKKLPGSAAQPAGGGSGGKGKKRAPLNLPDLESQWLTGHIKPEDDGTIEKEFLYAQYEQGCKKLKVKIRPPNTFGRILKQLFPAIQTKRLGPQTDQRQFYCGVTWVENATQIIAPPPQTSKSQPPALVTMAPLPIQPAPTPTLQPLQQHPQQRKSQSFGTPKKTSSHDALQPCNLFKENFANSSAPGFMNMKKGFLAKGALTQQDQFILPAYMTAPSVSTTTPTMRVPFQELKNPNLLPPTTPSSTVPVYTQWHNIVNPTLPHQKQKNARDKRAKKVEGVTRVEDKHGNQFYVVTKEQVLEKEEVSEEEEEEEMALDLDFMSTEDWQHAQKVQELVQHQHLQETLRQNERKRRQDSSTVIQVSSNKKRKDGGYEPFALVSEDATSAFEETLRDVSETVVVRLVQGFLSGYHVLTAEYDARHYALLNQYITAFAEVLWPFQPLHWSLVDQDMIANYLRNGEHEKNAMALIICVAIYGGAMILNHYEEGRAIHKLCIELYRNELKDLLDINVANAYITMASSELFFFDTGYGSVLAFELLDRAAAICEQVEGGTESEIYQRCINLMHFLVRGKEGKARDYDQFPVTEALAHPKMVLSHIKLAEIIRVRRLVLSVLSYHAQLLEATQNPHYVPNCLALPEQQVNNSLEYPVIEDVATFNLINNNNNNNLNNINNNNIDNAMQLTYFTMEEELVEEEEEEEEGESCLKYFERKVDPQDFKDWILVQKEDKVSPITLHHNLNILRHNGFSKTEQAKACLPEVGQRVLEVLLHFYHGLSFLKEGNMEEALKHGRQMLYLTVDEGFCIASMHLPLLVTIFKINRCVPELVELIHRSEKHRALSNVTALIHSAQVAIEEIQKEEEEMRQLEAERDNRAQVLGY